MMLPYMCCFENGTKEVVMFMGTNQAGAPWAIVSACSLVHKAQNAFECPAPFKKLGARNCRGYTCGGTPL